MSVTVLAAFISLVICQNAEPPAGTTGNAFPAAMPASEWRLWLDKVAPGVELSQGWSSQHALEPTSLEQAGALGPFDQRPQPALALPVESIWTLRVECWLTPSASVHLRRMGDGSYTALVVARQDGKSFVVACAATLDGARLVFDRTVPWGPCREARVCAEGGGMTLAPIGRDRLRNVQGEIDICSAALAIWMPAAVQTGPAENDWRTSVDRGLQSVRNGLSRFTIQPRKPRAIPE